jgi:hypothetical protein
MLLQLNKQYFSVALFDFISTPFQLFIWATARKGLTIKTSHQYV